MKISHIISLLSVCAAYCGTLSASTLTMQANNKKDFDATGAFQGFGKGSRYAFAWSQLNGHGYWNGDDKIEAGNDYVIPNKKQLRTLDTADACSFPGDSLTINAGADLVNYSRGACELDFARLTFAGNANLYNLNGNGVSSGNLASYEDKGCTRITGSVELSNAAIVTVKPSDNYNAGFRLTGSVSGAAGTKFFVEDNAQKVPAFWGDGATMEDWVSWKGFESRSRFELVGDNSAFFGEVELAQGNWLVLGSSGLANEGNKVTLDAATDKFRGSVLRVSAAGVMAPVRELDLGANSFMYIPVGDEAAEAGCIQVTSKLTVDGPITVFVSQRPTSSPEPNGWKVPVLKLAVGASGNLDERDFVYGGVYDSTGKSIDAANLGKFVVDSAADGSKTLYCVFYPYVTYTANMGSGATKIYPTTWEQINSVTDEGGTTYYFWSDHREIRAGYEYRHNHSNWQLRIPDPTTAGAFPGSVLNFAAENVYAVFNWSGEWTNKVSVIDDLRFVNGSHIANFTTGADSGPTKYACFGGRMTVSGTIDVQSGGSRRVGVNIVSKLLGDENSEFSVAGPTTPPQSYDEYFHFNLLGDTSEFLGSLTIAAGAVATSAGQLNTLSVAMDGAFGARDSESTVVVKSVVFADGSQMAVPFDLAKSAVGKIQATEECAISGKVTVRLEGALDELSRKNYVPNVSILSVPEGTALSLDSFELDTSSIVKNGFAFRGATLSLSDDERQLLLTLGRPKGGFAIIFR